MSMGDVQLAVLDMAGTTVTDDGVVDRAFRAALEAVGVGADHPDRPGHLETIRRTMGQSKIVVFRDMLGEEALAQTANEAFQASVAADVAAGSVGPIPGAAEALARLRSAGLKVCLTTGFSAETQAALVEHLGWGALVDLSLAPGPGVRGRPYPDLVFTAIMRLEVDGVDQVAVAGDTANDLLAGSRSGARVVAGVLSGAHSRAELAAAPHTHLLDSVADLPAVLDVAD